MNGHATIDEISGTGAAVVTEMTIPKIDTIFSLPENYLKVAQFELAHGANITFAGPNTVFTTYNNGIFDQHDKIENSIVKGIRKAQSSNITCNFEYSGYSKT
jgi:hypothetical protein